MQPVITRGMKKAKLNLAPKGFHLYDDGDLYHISMCIHFHKRRNQSVLNYFLENILYRRVLHLLHFKAIANVGLNVCMWWHGVAGVCEKKCVQAKKVPVKATRCKTQRLLALQFLVCNNCPANSPWKGLFSYVCSLFKICSAWPCQYLQDLHKVLSEQFDLQDASVLLQHFASFRVKSKNFFALAGKIGKYATVL